GSLLARGSSPWQRGGRDCWRQCSWRRFGRGDRGGCAFRGRGPLHRCPGAPTVDGGRVNTDGRRRFRRRRRRLGAARANTRWKVVTAGPAHAHILRVADVLRWLEPVAAIALHTGDAV